MAVTAGFSGRQNPEGERASAIAREFRVAHEIIDVSDEFIGLHAEKAVWTLERPPTWLNSLVRMRLFEALKSDVDVVLTGEGADGMYSSERASFPLLYDKQRR